MRGVLIIASTLFVLSSLSFAVQHHKSIKSKSGSVAGLSPDDCTLQFAGSARKAVKLRTQNDGSSYTKVNGGKPIAVADWFKMTCSLDPRTEP